MNQSQKTILAGGLAVVALAAVGFAVFGGKPLPSGKPLAKLPPGFVRESDLEKSVANNGPRPQVEKLPTQVSVVEEFITHDFSRSDIPGVPEKVRNIFKYPPPPERKPEPPPLPPPITLAGLSTQSVFGRTEMTNELVVRANPLPEGAEVFFDGSPAQGQQRISQNEIKITLSPEMTRTPRSITIQVKVPANPKMYSGNLVFNIVEPPKPDFQYLGYLADAGGLNPGALIKAGSETKQVQQGEDYGRFRFRKVTAEQIVVDDLQLKGVTHMVALMGGNPNPGAVGKF